MEKTIKLYDFDAYQTEFTATVLSCVPISKSQYTNTLSANQVEDKTFDQVTGLYHVILDQTIFFPEGGGQGADIGTIDNKSVLDAQIEDDIIIHTINAPFTTGSKVTGKIDWNSRYSNMQQHSGEHIVSGLICSNFGYQNVGFHLGSQIVTLDFNGFLEENQLFFIEDLANKAIYENIEVVADYPDKATLTDLEYRSKIEIDGPVRIVTFPGYDICACCAPHVKRTGEIGIIKIVDAFRHRGGIRISILCGERALIDYRQKQELVTSVSVLLSAKPELIAESVQGLKDEMYSLKGEMIALQESLIEQKAALIPPSQENLCLFEGSLETRAHRKYVNMLTEKHSGICAVFVGNDKEGYRYLIASKSRDVRPLHELLRNNLNAKGGGSKEMVQGSVLGEKEIIINLLNL